MGKGCRCSDGFCSDNQDLDTKTESDVDLAKAATPNAEMKEIVFVDKISKLDVIQRDEVQLAVWRQATADAQNYVAKLNDPSIDPSHLPTFEGVVTCEKVRQKLMSRLWRRWKLPFTSRRVLSGDKAKEKLRSTSRRALSNEDAEELVDDIVNLVHTFGRIAQSDAVYVKLHLVDNNGCAYWHQDCVDFRLVKTFRGPCTEWVPPEHSDATLCRYKHNSPHARSLSHRDVALFKGRGETLEEDDHLNQPGIVHRSPRILEGSKIVRLVLVLDVPQEGWHY